MKTIVAICILVAFAAGASFAQQREVKRSYGSATSSWTKMGRENKNTPLFFPNFSNDETSGTDTLWCVVGRDTTKKFPLLKSETIQFPVQCDTLMWRSSGGTIHYRVWGVW